LCNIHQSKVNFHSYSRFDPQVHRGKIEKYARLGMSTPKGMVIDTDGNERTDTEGILADMVKGTCALCPMGGAGDELGGYKGYGW
jgi:L-2-hydroxycarboxylate dehydrogenase (NAD+)